MLFRKLLKNLAPSYIRNYLGTVQTRLASLEAAVKNLETAVDILIESPKYLAGPEIGFNGQAGRKQIFKDLLRNFDFQYIIETGTWIGNTTGFMSKSSGLPVFSVESNRRFHKIAKIRLAEFTGITLENSDSRGFIKKLSSQNELVGATTFFYLDAHWYDDLPLKEEVEMIAASWGRFVIMVDDFKVPGDSGYSFDDYGENRALSLEYLRDTMKRFDLVPFFPAMPSKEETGAKQGCVVLVKRGSMSEKAQSISSLHI